VRPKKERAAPVAPNTTPIKSLNDERYEPRADRNQARDEFIDKLVFMADWFECLIRRIEQRQGYLEMMNAWGGCDDLAMEVRDFNTACRDLIASKKRRVG
jgi:hypothetical protein